MKGKLSMRLPRSIYAAGIFLVALAATGCGKKTAKVEGIVTLDGQPVPGAMVIFYPDDGGPQANGLTDADGAFRLTTFNTGDGATPGGHKVTVSKERTKEDTTTNVNPQDPDSMRKAISGAIGKDPRKELKKQQSTLPADYSDKSKTPLKYQVPADGVIKIELKSKGGT
jgi:hypothetical protein